MIDCQQAKEWISADIDGELEETEKEMLNEHLSICLSCQAYQIEMKELHEQLLHLPQISLHDSLVDQLIQNKQILNVNFQKKIPFWKKRTPWLGIAAAALLIGLWLPLQPLFDHSVKEQLYGLENSSQAPQMFSKAADEVKMEADTAENQNLAIMEDGNQNEASTGKAAAYRGVDSSFPYEIKEDHHQLIIYLNGEEVFRSKAWEEDQSVEWTVESEQSIVYSLYNSEYQPIAKYRIDLLEKTEVEIAE